MTPTAFASYLDALAVIAIDSPDVVGFVAFGSTAERDRADEWSDHDFAWITMPGAEDRYRELAPGWDAFPSAAVDAIRSRLGWPAPATPSRRRARAALRSRAAPGL